MEPNKKNNDSELVTDSEQIVDFKKNIVEFLKIKDSNKKNIVEFLKKK